MWMLVAYAALMQCGLAGCSVPMASSELSPRQQTQIVLRLHPQDAAVWINDTPVRASNGVVFLRVPPLERGRYRYRIRAAWGNVERAWALEFDAGQRVEATLTRDDPAFNSRVEEKPAVENYGIDTDKIEPRERIMLGDREITRDEAKHLLAGDTLPDDSHKLRLTIIGSDEQRKRVLSDLAGPLAEEAKDYVIQDYSPNHWAITSVGFHVKGDPVVYIQSPDGTVLHRQDDYADGAEGLRNVLRRLRKPDPNYRPDRDRDLRRLGGGWFSGLFNPFVRPFRAVLSWLLIVGLVFLVVMLIAKGWVFYLLAMLSRLIPGPPSQSQSDAGGTSTRTNVTKKSPQKSRARK